MHTSENIDQIATALAKAQGEIQNPAKDSENPHFRSRYADLSAGLNAVRPILSRNGIAVVQMTRMEGDVMMLDTRLAHSSGQWIESSYPVCRFPAKQQEAGSALTYSRRYSLFAMVGIAGEDDDGNEASKADTPAPARHIAPPRQTPPPTKNSDELARVILGTLEMCGSTDSLDEWLNSNRAPIDRLAETDKARVRLAFQARRKALAEDEYTPEAAE
jgi:hypothetical protein